MPGYYFDAPQAEFDQAMAALGIRARHSPATARGGTNPDTQRDILGNLVDRQYQSDAGTHAEELDRLAEVTAKPEAEQVDVRSMSNREYAEYCSRNGVALDSRTQTNALVYPDERPFGAMPAIEQQPPIEEDQPAAETGQAAVKRMVDELEGNPAITKDLTYRQRSAMRILRNYAQPTDDQPASPDTADQ